MSKYIFVAYKPSSSHENCRCGCSGYTNYDSDFMCEMVESKDTLIDLFYRVIKANANFDKYETGFEKIHVFEDGIEVFAVIDGWHEYQNEEADIHEIGALYKITEKRVRQEIDEHNEKERLAAEEKKARLVAEQTKKNEEAERAILKGLLEKYGPKY